MKYKPSMSKKTAKAMSKRIAALIIDEETHEITLEDFQLRVARAASYQERLELIGLTSSQEICTATHIKHADWLAFRLGFMSVEEAKDLQIVEKLDSFLSKECFH